MDGLFQDEAVASRRLQAFFTVRLATPDSQQSWGVAAARATPRPRLGSNVSHYTRREHVSGSLVPQAGLLTITARGAGVQSQVPAKPGERVRAGETLLTISGDQTSAAAGDTSVAFARSLQQRQAETRATLAALPRQEVDAQLALQRTETATSTALLAKAKPLVANGCLSTREFEQYVANTLNASAGIMELEHQRLDTEQQHSRLAAQLQQLPLTTAANAQRLRGPLAQSTAPITQNDVAREVALRASGAGTVASLLVEPGQSVAAGQSVLPILAAESPLAFAGSMWLAATPETFTHTKRRHLQC